MLRFYDVAQDAFLAWGPGVAAPAAAARNATRTRACMLLLCYARRAHAVACMWPDAVAGRQLWQLLAARPRLLTVGEKGAP